MPRQPFLPHFSKMHYSLGIHSLSSRPEHARHIANCINSWSFVENEMGNIFSTFLGSKSPGGLELFLSIRRFSNQKESLGVLSKYFLNEIEMSQFGKLMKVYGSLENERNALAHGCFGLSDDDPSILLWIDIKSHVHYQAEVLPKIHNGESVADPHKRFKEELFVYKLDDLEGLQMEICQLHETASNFNCYLLNRSQVHYKNEVDRCFAYSIFRL